MRPLCEALQKKGADCPVEEVCTDLAAFVDKCLIIRSHYLTTEKQKEELQSYTRGQEKKEAILEYIEDGYKTAMEEAINEL